MKRSMLRDFFRPPVEGNYYNPLDVRVGERVEINSNILLDTTFDVIGIDEYRRTIGSKQFVFTDYRLRGMEEQSLLTLRVIPQDDADRKFMTIMMRQVEAFSYDEGFHDLLRNERVIKWHADDGEYEFESTCDHVGKCADAHQNEHSCKYVCRVTRLEDLDRDGVMEKHEVATREVGYWDFVREANGETEGLFAEIDLETGVFEVYLGKEIETSKVHVYKE